MSTKDDSRLDAFISYRRSDGGAVARWLRRRLIEYRVPDEVSGGHRRPLRVYLDAIYERATNDFFDKNIKPNLERSAHLIVVCTPDVLQARADGTPNWVTREIEHFMRQEQGDNITPVLAGAGSSLPPPILEAHRNIEIIDLRAYSRVGWLNVKRKQLLDDEVLKIVASLLEIPDDQMPALRREESRRRQARTLSFAIGSAALLALVTALAIWALLSLTESTQRVVQNHTLQGQELFMDNPTEARLHFAQAVKTADTFPLRWVGLSIDAELARLWLGGYRRASPPMVFWHDAPITAAAVSSDGLLLATGTLDGFLRVWDLRSGEQHGEAIRHGAHIECVVFSPDGNLVVSAGRDNAARLWRIPSGAKIGDPIVHEDYVMGAHFDPSGKRLATVGADGRLRLTELATGKSTEVGRVQEGHRVEFSANGTRLLTVSADGIGRLWDTSSGAQVRNTMATGSSFFASFGRSGEYVLTSDVPRVWNGTTGEPTGHAVPHERVVMARFSPMEDRFATASWDKSVKVWDRNSLQQIGKTMLHPSPLRSIAWNHDGKLLATVDAESTVRVWNAREGELLETTVQHEQEVVFLMFISAERLITASGDGTARVTDLGGIDSNPWTLPHAVVAAFSSEGRGLITGSRDGYIRQFNVQTRQLDGVTMRWEAAIGALAVSADGSRLATVAGEGSPLDMLWSAQLWDLKTGARIGERIKPDDGVTRVRFSPDDSLLLLQGRRTVYLADARTGRLHDIQLAHPRELSYAEFDPAGETIATTSWDGGLRVWDKLGKPQGVAMMFPSSALFLSFSRDGRYMASSTNAHESAARVWDLTKHQLAGPILRHAGSIRSIRFDAPGRRVVTASDDGSAQVWDIATGVKIGRPLKHTATVWDARFSEDGLLVVTASSDGTARVWSSASGQPVGPIMEHGPRPVEHVTNFSIGINSAEVSPSGRKILTTCADGSVRVWSLEPTSESWQVLSLRTQVESISVLDENTGATGPLTKEEWVSRRKQLLQMVGTHL